VERKTRKRGWSINQKGAVLSAPELEKVGMEPTGSPVDSIPKLENTRVKSQRKKMNIKC
jgi:hypothetical protein